MKNDENYRLDNHINEYNFNYKGYFIENAKENEEPLLYEFGAHFSYKELYKALELLRKKQFKMQKGKKIEKIFKLNKKKVITRERNNTRNKNYEKENILGNIFNKFKFKGKSRNLGKEDDDILTFVPKNNLKNLSSLKKIKENKSVNNNYRTKFNAINYLKIYKNKISNINLNNIQLGQLSDKYLKTKQKQKNFQYQRMNLFYKIVHKNSKENNKFSSDNNLQKSFQNNFKNISKNNIKLNILPFYHNSHTNFKRNRKLNYKEINIKTSEINSNKTSLKKIQLVDKKGINRTIINSSSLNEQLGIYKSKINKNNSRDKKNNEIYNSLKKIRNKEQKFISTRNEVNNKLNTNMNHENSSFNKKLTISLPIENNDLKIIKTKLNKDKMKSIKHRINNINKTSVIKKKDFIFPYLYYDLSINNNIIKNKNSLNFLFKNNEKISRNKKNIFWKEISLINFGDNKRIYNNLSNVNYIQQNSNIFSKYVNKIKEKIKTDKFLISEEIPSLIDNKKNSFNSISNNYYSSRFIKGKYPNPTNNNTFHNAIIKQSQNINNLKGINPNKKNKQVLIKKYTLKNIIINSKTKSNNKQINNSKNKLKRTPTNPEFSNNDKTIDLNKNTMKYIKYQNLINNSYSNKNNINININNKNNNKIIYNNNFNNNCKTSTNINTKKLNFKSNKIIKKSINTGNIDKIIEGNIQNKLANKKYTNKVKFINIQFSNAKFLDILKNDGKK